ncbi:MAG: DUF5908 family protein [Cyanobacteria bacterium P01_H01_bin.21]
MPVEIRELILRATIVNGTAQVGQNDGDGGLDDATKEDIIAACTAQVLKILKREKER